MAGFRYPEDMQNGALQCSSSHETVNHWSSPHFSPKHLVWKAQETPCPSHTGIHSRDRGEGGHLQPSASLAVEVSSSILPSI